MDPRISIICALGTNRAIGRNNKLLWHLPDDLKRFKKITFGHPVIMGLRTYESIGRPLPERVNIIISDKGQKIRGCRVCGSVEAALRLAQKLDQDEIFVIGGGMVFAQVLPLAERLYLTVVEAAPAADTYFPDYSSFKEKIFEEQQSINGLEYRYLTLEK